ncbi:class II aldolase/adducin family protein [Yoonia sp. SS1-5]|uniref:Class II aldolase/adducin family protein n=1 Tax=Yoonia rhodophyticola TaxID=3137370 RepID=A0AAN0MD44_9RHOB
MANVLPDNTATRQSMIDACIWMGQAGINHGSSGNISVRTSGGVLITPSAVPYAEMTPAMICQIPTTGAPDPKDTPKPSTEWQFHQSALQARPDVAAVVHAHPPHATAISTLRKPIPAIHYMVAAFGGADVPVTDYALFGSAALAGLVASALQARDACLLANHGAITLGATLDQALWRMAELENLTRIFTIAVSTGDPVLLTEAEIAEALESFASYGR